MSEMQDLTPQERVGDGLLARILGENGVCGCGEAQERVRYDASDAQPTYAREGCGTCGCDRIGDERVCGFGVERGALAALFVPMQTFDGVYDMTTAMRRGTMFEELDKPFYGDGREVDCRGREK
ncbi:MAG: spore coat associated protein CotJA [Clostridia bacterium]|nr:spore coat associated protein CotJA [Clostridia bacterium]